MARRRDRAASSLTTTAVTTNTASASQFRESVSVNVWIGGRKNQLNTSIEAIETPIREARPPQDGDREDREDVEHAEAEHRHGELEKLDRARHGGDRDHARDHAEAPVAPGGLVERGGDAFHGFTVDDGVGPRSPIGNAYAMPMR